ncbi:MAG: formate/nitrite transporter family protein [Clostridia bacterium]|nr:formate/nitrite transporter family protein [Clostridia bacterium]
MKRILSAVAGGIMIGIGGSVFIACDVKYVGAFFFALGLFTICEFGLGLYTGKIGYLFKIKGNYYIEVIQTLIGNIIGTFIAGILVGYAKPQYAEKAYDMCSSRLLQNPLQTLILSFFCGILMFIAVNLFKKNAGIGRYIGIFTAVPVFILSGFEHSVADMFYFFCGRVFSVQALVFIAICVIGNALGSFAIAYFDK